MSRWQEQFDNHPIHVTLEWIKESITTEFNNIDESEVAEKRRALKIVSKYEDILKNIDPEVTPFNQLDALNNGLRSGNIAPYIDAYKLNGNIAHIVQINDLMSEQLTQLTLFTGLASSTSSKKEVNELEALVDSSIETLVKRKDALSSEYDKLVEAVKKEESTLAELSTQIEQKKSEVEALTAGWQSQFSNAQETRSISFTTWRDEFTSERSKEIEKAISDFKTKMGHKKSAFDSEITALLTDGKAKHEAILELYGLTAGDSVAAGYASNAGEEKIEADKWRKISVGFICATVAWMLFAYFSHSNVNHDIKNVIVSEVTKNINQDNVTKQSQEKESLDNNELPWFQLFITFSLSGVLLWGSAYSAQQSTKHRNNEKRTRWFALEVKAIDPFISSLDAGTQNELKKQLSERIFGQSTNNHADDTKVIDEHVLKVVADTLGGILSKIPK